MIHELRSDGLSISEIGRRLGIDRKTVRKYLQCACPAGVGGSRLELSLPGSQDRGAAAPRGTRFASCTGHRLEGAETAVQPLSTLEPRRQGKMQNDHGRSP